MRNVKGQFSCEKKLKNAGMDKDVSGGLDVRQVGKHFTGQPRLSRAKGVDKRFEYAVDCFLEKFSLALGCKQPSFFPNEK